MSDRNKKPNGISHNPFKDLKGLSVSNPPQKQPPSAGRPKPEPENIPRHEDPLCFEREMQGLGVKRLDTEDDHPAAAEDASHEGLAEPSGGSLVDADDAALFQQAVAGMDQIFKGELTESETGAAAPRRRKQLKIGQLKPEAQLDLHGLKSEEALQKVRFFLENARHHGFATVLIITGKGNRSDAGPVLSAAVAGLLDQMQEQVVEWITAPRQYGGSGALVVFLR